LLIKNFFADGNQVKKEKRESGEWKGKEEKCNATTHF
jgi:hypothetical protein